MMLDIKKLVKELAPLFRQAREAHDQFTQDWDENFPAQGLAYKETDLYRKRLEELNLAQVEIQSKILPVIDELKNGSITNLEIALAYLAVPDRHFRSGYNKEAIIKTLKHIELSQDIKDTVSHIWQTTESSLGEREKKEFTRLIEII